MAGPDAVPTRNALGRQTSTQLFIALAHARLGPKDRQRFGIAFSQPHCGR